MKKNLICACSFLFLVVMMIGCGSTTTTMTTTTTLGTSSIPAVETAAIKEETVYLTADASGTIGQMLVVSRLTEVVPGIYLDRGRFITAAGLSGDELMGIEAEELRLMIDSSYDEYYYRTELASGYEVPFTIGITYEADGNVLSPSLVSGVSGTVEMMISIEVNPNAEAYFRDNYLCNLQVKIASEGNQIVQANGGTVVLASGIYTVAFLALPGTSQTFSIIVETDAFGIEGVEASFVCFDPAMFGEGISGFSSAMDDLISGLSSLQEGQIALASGLDAIGTAVSALESGAGDLATGLAEYQAAAALLSESLTMISSNVDALMLATAGLHEAGDGLLSGYTALSAAIAEVNSTFSALHAGEEELLGKLAVMTQTASAVQAALEAYIGGVNAFYDNLAILSAGLDQLAEGTATLTGGLSALEAGSGSVADGLIQTSAGLAELSAAMPILIDAQTAMLSGLSDAMEELAFFKLDPGLPVSFTDPDNPAPVSVQFIYVIPGF